MRRAGALCTTGDEPADAAELADARQKVGVVAAIKAETCLICNGASLKDIAGK